MIRGLRTESGPISQDEIRLHLAKILASPTFADSDRLRTLLRWLVVETLEGRDETLKESVVGVAVFHRQPGWDQKSDAIVRVQVRNLRLCLGRYYEQEGCLDRVRVHIPKGGYHPVFERWASPALAQRVPRWALWLSAGLLTAMLCVVGWFWIHRGLPLRRTLAVRTFANLTGDPRQNLVAAGLTQVISAHLAHSAGIVLHVLPASTLNTDSHHQTCPASASYWLSGSLAPATNSRPDSWLVTVRLADCRTGHQVWTQSYDRSGPELESLSRLIASEVEPSLR